MQLRRVGPFNVKNVINLLNQLKRDDRLRAGAVRMARKSLPKFLEKSFALTPHQSDEMKAMLNPPLARLIIEGVAQALETGGTITFAMQPTNSTKAVNVGITVECEANPGQGAYDTRVLVEIKIKG